MKDLTVIIPIIKLDNEEEKALFVKALSSVDDSNIIVVGDAEALNSISDVKVNKMFMTIENKTGETNYAAQVNFAVKKVNTDYFTVLEYDDEYSSIWFKNVEKYIENDTENTFAFLPLTEIVDVTHGIIGYANEAVWASSFSEEIGCYDSQCLEDYLNFNMSGGVFKTQDFISMGMLKTSMKLSFWYEFLLRVLYKGKRIFVIPKVGYYHYVGRENSLSSFYANNMSEMEANWWMDLAKKEYFFPHDRKKTYQE